MPLLGARALFVFVSPVFFRFGGMLYPSCLGVLLSGLVFVAYLPDSLLCLYGLLGIILLGMGHQVGASCVFLIAQPPMQLSSLVTLHRWLRDVLGAAGFPPIPLGLCHPALKFGCCLSPCLSPLLDGSGS